MLRDGRLGDPELVPDHGTDLARRLLTRGEQFQYPASDRIPEYVERVHAVHYATHRLYKPSLKQQMGPRKVPRSHPQQVMETVTPVPPRIATWDGAPRSRPARRRHR